MKNKNIITLLLVLLLVFGVIALFLSFSNFKASYQYQKEIISVEEVTKTDDLDTIEKELNETNLDDIDKELSEIENEIDASLND